MLAALLTILFLSSGGSTQGILYEVEAVEKAVKQNVVDDDRRDAALDVVDDLEDRIEEQLDRLEEQGKTFDALLTDQDIDIDQLREQHRQYRKVTEDYYNDLLDLRFALREHVTRDEWELFDLPK